MAEYALQLSLPWLADFHQRGLRHLGASVMAWVLEGNRWLIKPIPQAPCAVLTKWGQNADLDDIKSQIVLFDTKLYNNNGSSAF